ncbi:MAG: HisA/HisF-related TIM barrel protein, partial [Alistipes dispar]
RLILGADIRDGAVAIQGWLESSALTAPELIGRFLPQGLAQVICTDISRDGMLCGPSAAFYAELQSRFPAVEITVSGGISGMDDIGELDRQGLRSVIVGKALYEGRITLKELERCLRNA